MSCLVQGNIDFFSTKKAKHSFHFTDFSFFNYSKHLSVGTFAITSLMVYSTIIRVEAEYFDSLDHAQRSSQNLDLNDESRNLTGRLKHFGHDHASVKLEIATGLAFWCGVVQVKSLF
jgi:hypothetical protein